jgi:3D (Asp-Asp-Asp) domain-containing protein
LQHSNLIRWSARIAIVVVLGFAILGFLYAFDIVRFSRPSTQPISVSIAVPAGESIMLNSTGYSIGAPYNTATRQSKPVITTGFITIDGMSIFTVAADPRVVPLGSLIYVDSLGVAMVTDTGEAIEGYDLDICFPTKEAAMQWGKKMIKITFLRRGAQH